MYNITKKLLKNIKKTKSRKIFEINDLKKIKEIKSEVSKIYKKLNDDHEYDPVHKIYILVQNLISIFAEDVSGYPDFDEFAEIIEQTEEEYMPQGPPMSPLTMSYYNFWALFDLKFGDENISVGEIFLEISQTFNLDPDIISAVDNYNKSRLGLYIQSGHEDSKIILKELCSNKVYKCICPAGYLGEKEDIWLTRLVPNIYDIEDYSINVITPYIIYGYSEKDWLEFLKRNIDEKNNLALNDFFKYGLDKYYWHNYIMDAYSNFKRSHILLTGIPDIKGTKPHELVN